MLELLVQSSVSYFLSLVFYLLIFMLCPRRFLQLYLPAFLLKYVFGHSFNLQKHFLPLFLYPLVPDHVFIE